jgi:NADH:ubiquinone oxidoreductase subunit 4 (subunit M)
VVLIAVLLIVGFYPSVVVDVINSGVVPLVDKLNAAKVG